MANGKAAVSLDVVGIDTASRASPQSKPTVLEADAVHGRAEFAERLLRAVLAVPDSTALASLDGHPHSLASGRILTIVGGDKNLNETDRRSV